MLALEHVCRLRVELGSAAACRPLLDTDIVYGGSTAGHSFLTPFFFGEDRVCSHPETWNLTQTGICHYPTQVPGHRR